MKHFTIENETNNITVYGSAKEADAVPDSERFSNETVLAKLAADWPAARLVEIFNSLPGVTEVRKFKDRTTAVSRIWKAIQNLGQSETAPAFRIEVPVPCQPEADILCSPEPETDTPVAPQTPDVSTEAAPAKVKAPRAKKAPKPATEPGTPREGSKTSRVIELLKREGGVTLKELMIEMGWQSHTTRALMSAGGSLAKKHGLTVVSTKGENGDRRYELKA